MKKIILSAAVAAMAFSGTAMAADKGIDITTNGQAVLWYQTNDTAGADQTLFDQGNSVAAAGIQLDLAADLKNDFTFGAQVSHISSVGLENNLVSGMPQATTGSASTANSLTDELALTKAFIAKKIGNTTVKIGRQELPKSLSPLAYTEGWNVFKNTFDAIVAVNTDLPNTTVVAAYVGASTGHTWSGGIAGGLSNTASLLQGAYMLTAQTTVIPMTTLTASYYNAKSNATAYWVTANIAPMDMVSIDLQGGNMSPKGAFSGAKDTDAYGAKVTVKPMDALSVYAAYSDVNDGALAIRNLGTGDKTPLFTSMVLTEDQASLDAKAWTLAASYNMGDMGNVMVRYGQTDTGDRNNNGAVNTGGVADADYDELNLIYSVKAGGVKYFAAYIDRETDAQIDANDAESQHIRVWARLNF